MGGRRDFEGRVCMVVGGSGGIGEALVGVLVERGCNTFFTYARDHERARAIVDSYKDRGYVEAIRMDVSRYEDVVEAARIVENRFGYLNHLAVLHGVSRGDLWNARWDELDLEHYMEVLRVDFGGFFNVAKGFRDLIMRSSPASIVAISSTPAIVGDIQGYPYLVAKAAVRAFAKSLAHSMAPRVRVNVVALGSIETRWIEWIDSESISRIIDSIPLKRLGKALEAAKAIAFLLSDDASYITGQTLIVDGGEVTI